MSEKENSCWDLVDALVGESPRVLLYGPPGTGKTFVGATANLGKSQEVYSITLTEESSSAELRGHFIPKDGSFVWNDGPAIQAWKTGGRLVINEIDHASGDVLTFLHAIMDDPEIAQLTLPTDPAQTVKPKKGFSVVATTNATPDALPFALRDRFPVCINVDEVNPLALENLSEDLRTAVEETVVTDNEERRISIRAWAEFDKLRKVLDEEMVAQAIFGHKATDVLNSLKLGKA